MTDDLFLQIMDERCGGLHVGSGDAVADEAMAFCVKALASKIAPALGASAENIADLLIRSPVAPAPLLETREGWVLLAAIAADRLGLEPPHLSLTVH